MFELSTGSNQRCGWMHTCANVRTRIGSNHGAGACPSSPEFETRPAPDSPLEQRDELLHLTLVEVGDGPVAHPLLGPMKEMVALVRHDGEGAIQLARRRPDHE